MFVFVSCKHRVLTGWLIHEDESLSLMSREQKDEHEHKFIKFDMLSHDKLIGFRLTQHETTQIDTLTH